MISDNDKPTNVEHLVVVRESTMYDYLLLEGMIDQTLRKANVVPGAEKMRVAGIDPLRNPKHYNLQRITRGRSKAVLIEEQGSLFLYSEGSAAKADYAGTNAFVALLAEIIETYKPRHLWVSVFSRLVRAAEHAGLLMGAVSRHVEVVHAEAEMQLSTPQGRTMWQVWTMLADAERNAIVTRLITGRVFWWRRGQWIMPGVIPMGYCLVDGELRLEPNEEDTTRRMLALLANPNLSASQICEQLGDLGASSRQIRRLHGEGATFADVRNPGSAVAGLRRWADLYRTGTFIYREEIPIVGLETIAGKQVQHEPGTAKGFIELPLKAPLPEGGWASDEVFDQIDAIRNTRPENRKRGGKAHRVTKPFVNHFSHDDGEYEYCVRSRRERYLLYRRPSGTPDRSWRGPRNTIDAEYVGAIRPSELHKSIAHGVAEAIRRGVPAELLADQFFRTAGDSVPQLLSRQQAIGSLKRRREEAKRLARRARKRAIEADDVLAPALLEDAAEYERDIHRIEQRLKELEDETHNEQLEDEWDSNAAAIAKALANLAAVENLGPAELRTAVDTIFCDTSVTPEGDSARWTVSVLLPTAQGSVKLGPITGTVGLRRQIRRGTASASLSDKARLLLAHHPDSDLAKAVIDAVESGETPNDPLIKHLVRIYSGDLRYWPRNTWRLNDQGRQKLVDTLDGLGGRATPAELRDAGIDRNHIHRFSREPDSPVAHQVATRQGAWGKGPGSERRFLSLIRCPHCAGFATQVLRVPEIGSGLLCRKCRRSPEPESPMYPSSYLDSVQDHRPRAA